MSSAVATPMAPADSDALGRIRAKLVRPMPADGWWGWALPLLITAVAGVLRFWRITRPTGTRLHSSRGLVFDETYYVHDSWNLLRHGVELNNGNTGPGFIAHPPLGKWMIAFGEWLFNHGHTVVLNGTVYPSNTFSFRFSSAVIGTLAILLVARIARRMFRSTALGCVAGLLLCFDGLEFVQSRIAMLDIFLMFWVLAAFGCLLLDRDDGRRRLAARLDRPLTAGERGPWLGFRNWRWLCGFCLGCACATKWDGIFWIPAFFVLAVFWDAGARRTAGSGKAIRSALLMDGLFTLVPFLVVAAAVYTVSWTGWFLSDAAHAYDHDRFVHGQGALGHGWAVFRGWIDYQQQIYHFHATLQAAHPYLSRPYGWLLLARPVSYFYASPHTCGASACSQEILAIGTPAIWWLTIPAFVAVFWRLISRFDWRAAAILVAILAGYLPWFREDAHHRTMFLFYMLPDVPFMVLALTMGIGLVLGRRHATIRRRSLGAAVTGVYLAGVIWNFGYFYPVLSAQTITYSQWYDRMWLHNCGSAHRNQHHEDAPCWI